MREKLLFPSRPSTEEEAQFPLAYGLLVNGNNSMQVYFLLSAVYQPQNAYCIAIDAKSAELLKDDLEVLGNCFPNIYVIVSVFCEFNGTEKLKKSLTQVVEHRKLFIRKALER